MRPRLCLHPSLLRCSNVFDFYCCHSGIWGDQKALSPTLPYPTASFRHHQSLPIPPSGISPLHVARLGHSQRHPQATGYNVQAPKRSFMSPRARLQRLPSVEHGHSTCRRPPLTSPSRMQMFQWRENRLMEAHVCEAPAERVAHGSSWLSLI